MSTGKVKLLLADLEAEVVQEALELYVTVRPVPIDYRFDYRYRAAQAVLESLRRGPREQGLFRSGRTRARSAAMAAPGTSFAPRATGGLRVAA